MTEYRHRTPVQLRFSDIDQLGHMNNTVSFALFDMAKAKYFGNIFGDDFLHSLTIVVANINANFFSPVFFHEQIVIDTAVVRLGNKSFTLHQRALNVDTGEVKVECTTVMVGFDAKRQVSVELPEVYKQKIREFEEM